MLNKVLLIDDDEITHVICTFILKKCAFADEIKVLDDGQKGIGYYDNWMENYQKGQIEKLPDLIFLDLDMPVMNGWDFLEMFSQQFASLIPQTKVVILSSSIDPEDYNRAKLYNFVIDFIGKPLTEETLSKLKVNTRLQTSF
ncbi:response regulator [Adhaeribacter aquaticus]|uniref:response regulator n=1 Tax=Adhaeribacter aquaticus TaxID=299567 RepID=UPI00041AEB9D|nr:response regulator [Adhaeribacter aquaticus]